MSETPRASRSPLFTRRFGFKVLLGVAITAGLFFFLFRYVNWPQVVALTQKARWGLLLAVIPLYELLYMARAQRFALLTPGTPFPSLLCIAALHNFMLRVLPMRSGELAYALLLRRTSAAGLGESLLGLFLLRILDATTVVIIFSIFLTVNQTLYKGDYTLGLGLTAGAALIGLLSALYFRQLLRFGFFCLAATLGALRLTRAARVARLLEKLRGAISSLDRLDLATTSRLLVQSGAVWMVNFTLVFVVMRGFSVPVSFAQAVLGGTGATVTAFLPVGGIGSFGTMEVGWALGFSLVGLEPGLAVASGFAYSFATFACVALLAAPHALVFYR